MELEDNYLEINVRGDWRLSLYDKGMKNTYFDVCSFQCATDLINQLKMLIGNKKPISQTR